ncbi:unnamed protein product [Cyprideis torosa]|uniref:Uncharacterized protein n=1 Tax=Cyprideis torosa TaxID=163714 RepID=A0A7R8WRY7_9CRUS|nr:unnamed protein product [Cyprideis torosa]CAG0904262.1 unnamed protein product [Cyprideis torosa]
MASEIQKEPSALEGSFLDEVSHFTKFEDSEVPSDPNGFHGSGENVPLHDDIPGSMDNDNQTCDVPDQIKVSEDDGTVRKGKNSKGHCQQKKRFTCAVCGKSLSRKQSLQSHELTHTGEKPFGCRICGKSFADRSTLRSHKLTHTGEKLFSSHLSSHKLTHEKGNRFHCSVCGKGFRSKEGFQGHTRKHSEEEQSVCALCGEPFRLVEDLEKHLKWHIQGTS